MGEIMNTSTQFYKEIPLNLIPRKDYGFSLAKRYTINHTNQNVWIPNKHLLEDGTILEKENLDYIFRKCGHQLYLAGIINYIIGIKRFGDPLRR